MNTAVPRAPDRFTTEPILAWRSWRLIVDPPCLRSTAWPIMWPTCEKISAECVNVFPFTDDKHKYVEKSPLLECTCGIYAYNAKEPAYERARRWSRGGGEMWPTVWSTVAIGQVSLWGEVIECDGGYRAQYAYPYSITIPKHPGYDYHRTARALRDLYVVDVTVDSELT